MTRARRECGEMRKEEDEERAGRGGTVVFVQSDQGYKESFFSSPPRAREGELLSIFVSVRR